MKARLAAGACLPIIAPHQWGGSGRCRAPRARSTVFGVDAYETLELKAAALLHSLVLNHPLVDGNKRLSLLATAVLLDLNGRRLELADDEAFDLIMQAARGDIDVSEIADRLRAA